MDKKNIIKNILHKEASDWDKNLAWQNIEQQIQPKKKRRPVLIFLFLIGISIAVVWNAMTPLKTPTPPIESRSKNDAKVAQNHLNKIKDHEISSQLSSNEYNTLSIQEEDEITKNTSMLASGSTYIPLKPSFNEDPVLEKPSQNSSAQNSRIKDIIEINLQDLVNVSGDHHTDNVQNTTPNSVEIKKDEVDYQYEASPLPILIFKSIGSNNVSNISVNQQYQKPIKHHTNPQWYMSFSSSYAAVHRKINPSDPLTLNYSNTQEQHVTPNEAISATWMVNKKTFKNIYFSSGVRYLQINEFLVAEDVIINSGMEQNDQAYVINNTSGNTYLSGERAYTHRQGFSIKSPNKYQRINIPLGVHSMSSIMGRTFTLGVGMDLNIYQRYSGINLGLDEKFIYHEANKFIEIYRKNWVNSWFVHFHVDILKYNDFRMSIGGHYASDIGSTVRSRWAVNQNYSRYGLEIGLAHILH